MDPLTLATTSHVLATLVAGGVGIYALRSRGFQRPTLHLIILALGIVAGMATVASGFYLIEKWAVLMEQFDFTERMRPIVNPRRYPDSFYFLPAFSTTFGVVSTLAFITLLFRRIREIG
jgi:hypothetical protein